MKFRGLRPDEIEVRIGTVNKKGANMLLYKDARCDMNILDETVGEENWQRDHKEIKDNMYAGIGIYNDKISQWVWKWDCGTESNTEKEKGEASDSFKRAGFNWGIGRELYTGGRIFIPCETIPINEKDQYPKYKLKDQFALYGISVSEVTYIETGNKREINVLVICDQNGKVIFQKGSTQPKQETKPNKQSEEPNGAELAEVEAIKNRLVNPVELASIEVEMLRTGVKAKQLYRIYGVNDLKELTFEQWTDAMATFAVTKDKKQLNL